MHNLFNLAMQGYFTTQGSRGIRNGVRWNTSYIEEFTVSLEPRFMGAVEYKAFTLQYPRCIDMLEPEVKQDMREIAKRLTELRGSL